MSSPMARLGTDAKLTAFDESFDLEALPQAHSPSAPIFDTRPLRSLKLATAPSAFQKFLGYPVSDTLKLRPTSWLDGVRGVAALGVYIFHAMGCWASIVSAWHADDKQNNIMQLPIIRTLFVSGGAAVSLFFALSGYVLTQKSLRRMREGARSQVYPDVVSSMFRRGFRLYLPPILLTFCEMVATRFGVTPPLNFTFVAEPTFYGQFLDWLKETNRLANPLLNAGRALRGFVTHLKYDAVIWTIPLEFYGSFVCYISLLLLARVPSDRVRMSLVAAGSVFAMLMGSWNNFCFLAGMLMADFHLSQEQDDIVLSPRPSRLRKTWIFVFAVAFYVAGYPTQQYREAVAHPMSGFEILRSFTPTSLDMEDHSRFWWSLSGVVLLFSISQLPQLKCYFETNFCQYLGKISFSLYLVHEFCIVLFGLSLQRLLLRIVGLMEKEGTLIYWVVCGIWFVMFTTPVFAVAACVEKWVDGPSVKFARWLESRCLILYRGRH